MPNLQSREIVALFDVWNTALQTGDPDQVVACYSDDAILLPTVSNAVRHNHAEIRDYFVEFCAKSPVGHIQESNTRSYDDIVINSGVYVFDFADGSSVPARFTFVYQCFDNQWKIVEHHSSAMPE